MTSRIITQCLQCAEYEPIGQKKGICEHPEGRDDLIDSEEEIPDWCPRPEAV